MTAPDGGARPEDQIAAAEVAMAAVADLVADGYDVVVTHGNGPQVGNLLVKNELAASVVPPVPLDWCGAQTQATLGFRPDGRARAGPRRSRASPGRQRRSSPARWSTGRRPGLQPADQADRPLPHASGGERSSSSTDSNSRTGESAAGAGSCRRRSRSRSSTPPRSPTCVAQGYVVVANGGGGIPVVREAGRLRGVEAVIDKDLGATLLAVAVGADRLVIATDVELPSRFRHAHAQPIGEVTVGELRRRRSTASSRAARWARRSTPSAGSSSRPGASA